MKLSQNGIQCRALVLVVLILHILLSENWLIVKMHLTEIVCVMDGSAYCVQWWALVSYGTGSGVGTRQVITKLHIRTVGCEVDGTDSYRFLWLALVLVVLNLQALLPEVDS
jgi:hypothetical protein